MVEDTGFDKFIQDLFYGLTQKKRGVCTSILFMATYGNLQF